jgi:sugar phosphate isomerase/epimerase
MAAAAELRCPTVILHLNHYAELEERRDAESLLQSLDVLIETGENMKVKLAAENLYDQRSLDFLRLALTTFKSDFFGLCYDSSHDMLSPSGPYRILEDFADRVIATHLSDNDGKEDRHWPPFTGIVDWVRICAVLHDAGYSYPLLLEVENSERVETATFLENAYKAASRLRGMVE